MESPSIAETLDRAETAASAGEGLGATGFWKVVGEIKRRPELVERYADQVAVIDRRAHRNWALMTIPMGIGTVLAVAALAVGIGLLIWASFLEGVPAVVVFFAGLVALLGSTHGLGHLVVGSILGMRFTAWFVGEILKPQPGVKIDYASYLRTDPVRRAWMHASGAIVTKTIPFLLIAPAVAIGLPAWAIWGLPVLGLAMIVSDVFWSSRSSDWKRFRREMAFAQSS